MKHETNHETRTTRHENSPRPSVLALLALPICLLLAACGGGAPSDAARTAAPADAPKIIVHRGGVVGDEHAENSPAAIEAAIGRGYWMLEVDIRESKDGKLVVHHDPDYDDFYGDPRLPAEMTWAEIEQLPTSRDAGKLAANPVSRAGRVVQRARPAHVGRQTARAFRRIFSRNGISAQ